MEVWVEILVVFVEGVDEDEQFSLDGDGALHFDFGFVKDPVVNVFEGRDVFGGDQGGEVQRPSDVPVSLFGPEYSGLVGLFTDVPLLFSTTS